MITSRTKSIIRATLNARHKSVAGEGSKSQRARARENECTEINVSKSVNLDSRACPHLHVPTYLFAVTILPRHAGPLEILYNIASLSFPPCSNTLDLF